MYVLRTSCMYSILTVMAPFQNHISMIGNPFIKPHVVIYNRTISFRVLQTNDGLHPKEKSTSNSLLDIDHYSLTYQKPIGQTLLYIYRKKILGIVSTCLWLQQATIELVLCNSIFSNKLGLVNVIKLANL